MAGKQMLFTVMLALLITHCAVAQTPTPLPGTPQALTCVPYDANPGLGAVTVIDNWEYLDRACILLENTSGTAIEIAYCWGYFGETSNLYGLNIRIWEVRNEALLPDLSAAASQVSITYAFGGNPIAEPLALILFDLEGYESGTVPMPVINPGKKFIVEFMNYLDDLPTNPGMKIAAEMSGQCPPSFWATGTNIFCDYDPPISGCYWKEDISDPTNFLMGVTYYGDATPRAPSMGFYGIAGVIAFISLAIIRRRKR
ncbi:MAG TPA: hypothetical protein PLV45_07475 [bacterium]|nr:hypothetical protein [bacterium]